MTITISLRIAEALFNAVNQLFPSVSKSLVELE